MTNLDPTSTLALVSTASENQALFLRDFVYKHLTFQSGMDVKFHVRSPRLSTLVRPPDLTDTLR